MHRIVIAPALATLCLLVGACASTSPDADARPGEAWSQLRAQQTFDPDAPQRHGQATTSLDGRATREGQERYVDSFRTPPAPQGIINIGVGGSAR
jgi:hypothetical protein